MTKRISQPNTVVVPAVHAEGVGGKAIAATTVVVPAEAEVASVKVEVKTDEAPVAVVTESVAALVAPAPMAMVAEPVAAADPAAASASTAQGDDDNGTDLTPYIVGGVLILGGVLAVALSSGDTDPIAVTPAPTNTAPNFTSATTATFAENQPAATVFYDANASDTQGNAIVFSLGTTGDAALFNIDPATGVVTLKTSANFEAKSTYTFAVTATDNGSPALSTTQTVTVTITNVNEQPTFATATATVSYAENTAVTTPVFTALATDPDVTTPPQSPLPVGAVVAYTLGGADAAAFNINAQTGVVTFKASPDFETKATYTFTVTATDNATPTPLSSTQTVTVNVTDVPEGPVFTSPATATIAENAAAATVVFDANAPGATSFTLGGADAAAFNFDTATGIATLKTPADFETKAAYNVTVTANSPGGPTTQAIVVGVTNVNEAPAFAAGTRTTAVAENVAAGTTVFATGGAVDPDAGATVTYTLTGTDAAAFAVNATTGAVTFVASPNFEAKASYSFNLVATDQAGLSSSQANTVTVTNVNETPTFATATQTVTVPENTTATVLTATATDPDGAVAPNTLTYTLTGADAALFNVSAAGAVTFKVAPDFEATPTKTTFNFNVVATDQGGLSVSQAETVTITNVNEAPTFAAATRTSTSPENVAAGTTVFTTGGATDPEGAAVTYSLSGTDAAAFAVNATTGAVTFVGSPNFEAKPSYSFNLVATDAGGLANSQANTVTITNLNEAPTVSVPTTAVLFLENTPTTTTVFTATAADVDAGATRTFSLTGADAALFAIDANGAVTFRASPNFEATPTKTSYSVSVVVTDQGGLTATSTPVTVTLGDVNEAPVFATPTATGTVAENVATTATVFTAAATDVDSNTTLSYGISGTDAGLFNINATTGAVTFKASPNFEATPTKTSYNFTVTATDSDVPSLSGSQTVTLNLTDLNEAPTFAAATRTAAIDENVAIGTVVPGSALATDVDAGAVLTYSLSGADAARFTINQTTGVVSLAVSPDFETKPVYNFNVVATDNGGLASTQAVTLNINDLPEGVRIDGGAIPASTNTNFDAAVGNVLYLESGALGNVSTINNFTTGDIIQTDVATSNYSFGSQGSTLVITYNNNGTNSQIFLPGAAGNSFIFNEASAEQAVGFDFFRSSATPPPPAGNALAGTASYNAAGAAVTYTDDVATPNTSTINNFTNDDRIVATGTPGTTAATQYSFGVVGQDLTITFNNNGVVSTTTLVGVANPNVFVFDEASAEQSVGFDFFRYG